FRRRGPVNGLTHHSDRGVQYASKEYTDLLKEHGVRISMSRSGNPYDNAKCESFMKTLKYEEVYRQEYRDLADARASIERFIEKIYNGKRLHSALGYRPPVEFERSLLIPSSSQQPEQTVSKMRAPSGCVFLGMTESIGPMCHHFFLPLGRVPLSGRAA